MNRFFVCVLFLNYSSCLLASPLEEEMSYLKLIEEFSASTCNEIATEGEVSRYKVEGEINAEIPGLIKKLLKAGASVDGEIENNSYVGVPRESLAKLIGDNSICKKELAELLLEKIGPWNNSFKSGSTTTASKKISEKWNETQLSMLQMVEASSFLSGSWSHFQGESPRISRRLFGLSQAAIAA